jgi:outer membrane lipoprotein-sorting protein
MHKHLIWTLMAALLTAPLALADDHAEKPEAAADAEMAKIEKAVIAAWKSYKSMTADMEMTTNVSMAGVSMTGQGSGKMMMSREGDTIKARMELENTMTQKMGETENKMEQSMLTVSDGEVAYTMTEQMGAKTVVKMDAEKSGQSFNPEDSFKQLREQFELKALPEQTVDGRKMWVIEGTPKQPAMAAQISKMEQYIDQQTGVTMKQIMYGADGSPMQTMTIKNVKFDEKIDDAMFKFDVPEGVQVIDQTSN